MTRNELYKRLLAQISDFCTAMIGDSEAAFNDAYSQAAKLGPVDEVNLALVEWRDGEMLRMGLMAVLNAKAGVPNHGDN